MNNRFNWQSFISIALLFAFVIMLVSGVILYIAPEGSLSRWIGWDVLNLTKKQWEHQHTIFSYLFILFSVFHIFKINWGLLISYFKFEKFNSVYLKEILIALAIVILVFIGTLFNWKPFSSVISWGNTLSDNYGVGVEYPTIADAEKLTLHDFATKVLQVSYSDLKEYSKRYTFNELNRNSTIMEFCKINKITPEDFYIEIKKQLSDSGGLGFSGKPDISSIESYLDHSITIL